MSVDINKIIQNYIIEPIDVFEIIEENDKELCSMKWMFRKVYIK